MYITEEGEIFPLDAEEREREIARMQVGMEARSDGIEGPDTGAHEMLEEEEDECTVNVKRAPREPSEEERRQHEATHLPYRSWCAHCVKGRGRNTPHRHGQPGGSVPKISMAFFFMGCAASGATEHPLFVKVDERTGNRFARAVQCKG